MPKGALPLSIADREYDTWANGKELRRMKLVFIGRRMAKKADDYPRPEPWELKPGPHFLRFVTLTWLFPKKDAYVGDALRPHTG